MSNLVIDIGNTRTKIAVFRDRKLLHNEVADQLSVEKIQEIVGEFQVSNSIVSSVAEDPDEVLAVLEKDTVMMRFSHRYPASVKINYKTPETLGLDRLAGVIAARVINTGNTLVIDCGTCITMDAVTSAGEYSGGSISPGLNMRLKALHTFTGKLPLVALDNGFTQWQGKDTEGSILSGVLEGTFQEVLGFINRYVAVYPGLKILLCGGDANFFDTRLKNSIFADIVETEPALVLIGLNEVIHHYND